VGSTREGREIEAREGVLLDPRVDVPDVYRKLKVVRPDWIMHDLITFCSVYSDQCGAERERWYCTRERGHGGKHIAHTDQALVCSWWEDE